MNRLKLVAVAFVCIVIVACGNTSAEKEIPDIQIEQKVVKRQSTSCATDTIRCVKVSVNYPQIINNCLSKKPLNDSIMSYVRDVLAVIDEESEGAGIDKLAEKFIAENEVFLSESEAYSLPWIVDINGKILHQKDKIISVELATYSFTGGAHPNSFVTLFNFDLTKGKKIDLQVLIKEEALFIDLAKKYFRKARSLDSRQSLASAGFFWGESFILPENYAVVEKGIQLYYNSYEVAAYALGPTHFVIPFEELEGILNEELIFDQK